MPNENVNWQELIDATIDKVNEEVPKLLADNQEEILASIASKVDPENPGGAIDASFKIDAKLHIEEGVCSLQLTISWSNLFKKSHPLAIIDLHPQLEIEEE